MRSIRGGQASECTAPVGRFLRSPFARSPFYPSPPFSHFSFSRALFPSAVRLG